jgi:hypothetical protein
MIASRPAALAFVVLAALACVASARREEATLYDTIAGMPEVGARRQLGGGRGAAGRTRAPRAAFGWRAFKPGATCRGPAAAAPAAPGPPQGAWTGPCKRLGRPRGGRGPPRPGNAPRPLRQPPLPAAPAPASLPLAGPSPPLAASTLEPTPSPSHSTHPRPPTHPPAPTPPPTPQVSKVFNKIVEVGLDKQFKNPRLGVTAYIPNNDAYDAIVKAIGNNQALMNDANLIKAAMGYHIINKPRKSKDFPRGASSQETSLPGSKISVTVDDSNYKVRGRSPARGRARALGRAAPLRERAARLLAGPALESRLPSSLRAPSPPPDPPPPPHPQVGSYNVVKRDIDAGRSVVNIIDGFLIPPSLVPTMLEATRAAKAQQG